MFTCLSEKITCRDYAITFSDCAGSKQHD